VAGNVKGGNSAWRVRIDGDRTPEPLLQGGESTGMVSPDGKWLAFMGTPDPQFEVFVQPYPGLDHAGRFRSVVASSPLVA
jgi:hypothetical protein